MSALVPTRQKVPASGSPAGPCLVETIVGSLLHVLCALRRMTCCIGQCLRSMSCLSRYTKRYRLLPSGNDKEKNNDNDIDDYNSSGAQYDASRSRWLFLYVFALCFTAFAGLAVGFSASTLRSQIFKLQSAEDENAPRVCSDPLLRREWRSLAKAEKSDYIEAVKCLNETPSVLGLNQSLYADFPWIHNRIGEYCKTS